MLVGVRVVGWVGVVLGFGVGVRIALWLELGLD